MLYPLLLKPTFVIINQERKMSNCLEDIVRQCSFYVKNRTIFLNLVNDEKMFKCVKALQISIG